MRGVVLLWLSAAALAAFAGGGEITKRRWGD